MHNFAVEFCGSTSKTAGNDAPAGDMRYVVESPLPVNKQVTIKEIKTNSHVKNLSDYRQESNGGQ